ncbi:MAG: hypothetical protein K2I81_03135 [Alphaproteobacteria bacterium]|nr:hypothetical protein [Alphaproteobacteria bacterium]
MKQKSIFSYYALIAAIVASAPASAGVRVGNLSRSYADSYSQVNGLRMGTVGGQAASMQTQDNSMPPTGLMADAAVTTGIDSTGAIVNLPVRVANADLAKRIALGETVGRVGMGTLESCSRIYPEGDFAWDTPTAGTGSGGAQTCIAVVEMRAINADGRGGEAVLARANIAAGDNIKCNISDFPEYSYTEDAGKIEFPADHEPTMDDVVAQMNQEQKQNAGLKIAAGALIGGIGGNIAGKAERGSDSIIGTGKDKMKTTAIGALSGAAIMAGNSYAGKVGGDVILSTGVNAAAGGVMGNIMASGNSVLRIEECEVGGAKTSCLWGSVVKTKQWDANADGSAKTAYYNVASGDTIECDEDGKKCNPISFASGSIRLEVAPNKTLETLKKEQYRDILERSDAYFKYDKLTQEVSQGKEGDSGWAKISVGSLEDGMAIRAMVPGVSDKAFGMTSDDWSKWRANNPTAKVWGRNVDGNAYALDENYTLDNFRPLTIDAEDGGIVDISNKARLKSTLTGAGIGGAMGGFVGYQGAQSDIDDRWVSAVREYKDSLTRIYCATGKRYLGQYNDTVLIPALNQD